MCWQVLARVYCAFAAVWSLGANLHEAGYRFRGIGSFYSLLCEVNQGIHRHPYALPDAS